MNGCNGRMGQVITGLIEQDETVEIVAGIDQYDGIKNDYPVYASIEDCEVEADAGIDFSNAAAVDGGFVQYRAFGRAVKKSGGEQQKSGSVKVCKHVTWRQHAA